MRLGNFSADSFKARFAADALYPDLLHFLRTSNSLRAGRKAPEPEESNKLRIRAAATTPFPCHYYGSFDFVVCEPARNPSHIANKIAL